jgi:hypothetical protein
MVDAGGAFSVRRLLTVIGVVSVLIGSGAIAYAHIFVAPELRRSVDVLGRVADDSAATIAALSRMAEATDALRAPGEDVTRRSVAALKPGIAMLESLADTARAIPVPPSLAKLAGAVDDLTAEARRLQTASRAFVAQMDRHETPSFRPVLAAAAVRIQETQGLLAYNDPARGMTLLADLIAGTYIVLGAALIVVARGVKT